MSGGTIIISTRLIRRAAAWWIRIARRAARNHRDERDRGAVFPGRW